MHLCTKIVRRSQILVSAECAKKRESHFDMTILLDSQSPNQNFKTLLSLFVFNFGFRQKAPWCGCQLIMKTFDYIAVCISSWYFNSLWTVIIFTTIGIVGISYSIMWIFLSRTQLRPCKTVKREQLDTRNHTWKQRKGSAENQEWFIILAQSEQEEDKSTLQLSTILACRCRIEFHRRPIMMNVSNEQRHIT